MPTTSKKSRRKTGTTPVKRWRANTLFAGVMLAITLFGVGGFLLLSGSPPAKNASVSVGGPFTLIDGDGKQVTDRDFRGRYLLVYFGYTFCPDVCPTTLNEVAVAMQELGAAALRVQPLFVTVDPQRDTPGVVKRYAAAFDPRLIGLTGSPEQVAQVAQEYRVYYADRRTTPRASDYTVDHSSLLYLVGPDGRFVAPIRADKSGAAIGGRHRQTSLLKTTGTSPMKPIPLMAFLAVAMAGAAGCANSTWNTGHSREQCLGESNARGGEDGCGLSNHYRQRTTRPVDQHQHASGGGAEVHETINAAGVTQMRPVTGLRLAAGKAITLGPGGYHIMLTNLKQPLTQGETFPLTLAFEHAKPVTVQVKVAGVGAPSPMGNMSGMHEMPGMTMGGSHKP